VFHLYTVNYQLGWLYLNHTLTYNVDDVEHGNKQYHTVRIVRKFNRKIVEKGKIDTPYTGIYDHSISKSCNYH